MKLGFWGRLRLAVYGFEGRVWSAGDVEVEIAG